MTEGQRETVEVFGADWCTDTARTIRCLRRLQIPFAAIDVDDDLEALREALHLNAGQRRTPVVRVGGRVLVEPSNEALLVALEEARLLAPSTVHALEHGQNVGDLERLLRLAAACAAIASTTRAPWPIRLPIRLAAIGVALTAAVGWCPVYDARGVSSLGGPGDRPDESERDEWFVRTRAATGGRPYVGGAAAALESTQRRLHHELPT